MIVATYAYSPLARLLTLSQHATCAQISYVSNSTHPNMNFRVAGVVPTRAAET